MASTPHNRSAAGPDLYTAIYGGEAEVALAKTASARLLVLLNAIAFTVETAGLDGTGKSTLATIRIVGRDVGDILIEEGLARSWSLRLASCRGGVHKIVDHDGSDHEYLDSWPISGVAHNENMRAVDFDLEVTEEVDGQIEPPGCIGP